MMEAVPVFITGLKEPPSQWTMSKINVVFFVACRYQKHLDLFNQS
jgi:hypothetical protein